MQTRPLLVLAALAAASEPDLGRGALERLKTGIRDTYQDDPIGASMTTMLVASWAFYRAEVGKNPKVTSIYDALVFVSTSLSVGYSDIFPKTPTGKALSSLLMTFGPSMTAGLLDEPNKVQKGELEVEAVLERLDRIVVALEARSS